MKSLIIGRNLLTNRKI